MLPFLLLVGMLTKSSFSLFVIMIPDWYIILLYVPETNKKKHKKTSDGWKVYILKYRFFSKVYTKSKSKSNLGMKKHFHFQKEEITKRKLIYKNEIISISINICNKYNLQYFNCFIIL